MNRGAAPFFFGCTQHNLQVIPISVLNDAQLMPWFFACSVDAGGLRDAVLVFDMVKVFGRLIHFTSCLLLFVQASMSLTTEKAQKGLKSMAVEPVPKPQVICVVDRSCRVGGKLVASRGVDPFTSTLAMYICMVQAELLRHMSAEIDFYQQVSKVRTSILLSTFEMHFIEQCTSTVFHGHVHCKRFADRR